MVAREPPHFRALSATLGSAMVDSSPPRARALAVTVRSQRSMADLHRPSGTYGPARTLSATLVSAVMKPPNSSNSSNLSPGLSTSPSLSTALGGSLAAHAPP